MVENMENQISVENAEELDFLKYSGDEDRPLFENIRVTKKDFSIFELYRKYKNSKLILDVDFQRKSVWELNQEHELVESILMGLPLPIFYFKQQDNATYVVVDGKQRLTAIFRYLNNEFSLKSLKILTFLNGKKFRELKDELGIYQSQLEDYQVYSHVILPPTPDKILFDIFDRVNRGGTKLNKQEIRNALYHGNGLDMINEITKTEEFKKATRIDPEKDNRLKGSYLVTRFLSFYLCLNDMLKKDGLVYEYNGDADDLIEVTLTQLNQYSNEKLKDIKKLTINCLVAANDILGRGAFRKELKESKPINMNIFETTLYFMTLILEKNRLVSKSELKKEFYKVIIDDKYLDYIGDSRDNLTKVTGRFSLMKQLAEEICNDR